MFQLHILENISENILENIESVLNCVWNSLAAILEKL